MDIRLIIYAVALSAIVGAWAYIKSTIGDNATLTAQNEQWQANYESLKEQWQKERERLKERDITLQAAEARHKKRERKLMEEIENARKSGDKCVDADIPAGILERLRHDSAAGLQ